jgi:rare lipoprotein A
VILLAGCHKGVKVARQQAPPPVVYPPQVAAATPKIETVPQAQVRGKPLLTEVGLASWYGPPYSGRKGADGKVYDQNAMTAAHLTLPLGTMVRVTNIETGQSAVVRITDRGPFVHGRILDLSLAAAKATGVYRAGVAKVRVEAFAAATSGSANVSTIPGGRWCVQIGAFMNQEDALSLKNDLMRRYTTAKVIEFAGPTGHWVRINPKFPDKGTAEQVAESIHVPDAEPYLIRLD